MLRRYTEIAHVSECVLALTRSKERVKLRLVRVEWRLRSLCLLRLDGRGSWLRSLEALNRIRSGLKLLRGLLFSKGIKGRLCSKWR